MTAARVSGFSGSRGNDRLFPVGFAPLAALPGS